MIAPVKSSSVFARVVRGHRVASGLNGDARFPGGTLRMQAPHFRALGLELGAFHTGTLNVSIAPARYRVVRPKLTFRQVKWHPVAPAEDFSFFDVQASDASGNTAQGLIYFPHPETKPEHFQAPDVLELLLPFAPWLQYDVVLRLETPQEQIVFEPSPTRLP